MSRKKIYFYINIIVLTYGLIFIFIHIPSIVQKNYFNHKTQVKLLLKSIEYINKVYSESTPSEKKEIEYSLKKLNGSLFLDSEGSECKK
jgi:hypothetical protein